MLPGAPDTKLHLRPQAQAATTCRPAQLARWGPQVGTGVKGGVNPPVLSALLGQQKVGGGPFPLPLQAAGPAHNARTALERGTFHAYFVLSTVQKSSQSQLSLRAQP